MVFQILFAMAPLLAVAFAAPYAADHEQRILKPTRTFKAKGEGNFIPSRTSPPGSKQHVLATSQQVFGPVAVHSINNQDGIGAGFDSYIMYWGDGSTGAGWPDVTQWVSFEDMFNNNKDIMFHSCEQFVDHWGNTVPNDSGPEIGAIYDSVQQIAIETNLDHRFILAAIIQESGGCVRAPTTNFGVRNPGLMQDHNGAGTCNSDIDPFDVQNPCPTETIELMIREGSAGTDDGDGLAALVNQAGAADTSAFYKAARLYNSGSIDESGKLEAGIATHCYASDIANRLTGWVHAAHGCGLDG